jgi:hypothetical protein
MAILGASTVLLVDAMETAALPGIAGFPRADRRPTIIPYVSLSAIPNSVY